MAGKVVSTEKEAKTGERLPLPADARDSRFCAVALRPCRACAPAEGAEAKVMALGEVSTSWLRENAIAIVVVLQWACRMGA